MMSALLGTAAQLLPPGRRQWAEALQAEAGQVEAGWPRLRWLAGGLWLVAREAQMMRKLVYWLGLGAVAAAAVSVVWVSWQASPAVDPQTVTDRVRVLVGVAGLVVLPWVGRRRGWFGPVGRSITMRLVRVAGCAAICGLGLAVVRMDSHLGLGPHGPGPFSLPREIAAVVVLGAALAGRAVLKARWPNAEATAIRAAAAISALCIFVAVPLQALAIVYIAAVLAATSRRSPIASASLAAGTIAGLAASSAAGLATYEIARTDRHIDLLFFGVVATAFLLAALAGVSAAWLVPSVEDPQQLREARIRQGVLAGTVAGAACGMLLTNFYVIGVVMMVIGPLVGAVGGAAGGVVAADHPRKLRADRSWAAEPFVRYD